MSAPFPVFPDTLPELIRLLACYRTSSRSRSRRPRLSRSNLMQDWRSHKGDVWMEPCEADLITSRTKHWPLSGHRGFRRGAVFLHCAVILLSLLTLPWVLVPEQRPRSGLLVIDDRLRVPKLCKLLWRQRRVRVVHRCRPILKSACTAPASCAARLYAPLPLSPLSSGTQYRMYAPSGEAFSDCEVGLKIRK